MHDTIFNYISNFIILDSKTFFFPIMEAYAFNSWCLFYISLIWRFTGALKCNNAFITPFSSRLFSPSPPLSSYMKTDFCSKNYVTNDGKFRYKRQLELSLSDSSTSSSSTSSKTSQLSSQKKIQYEHTLAVLTLPLTSSDRIANEAILSKAISCTVPSKTLSVILRCRDADDSKLNDSRSHSLSALRGYVGEIYSAAWDNTLIAAGDTTKSNEQAAAPLLNVIVYPQNLPNTPPESWLHHRPDLECVCSHDSILGWHSTVASTEDDNNENTGLAHTVINGEGLGGLDAHVQAMNDDRRERGLKEVVAVHVDPWPVGASASSDSKAKDFIVFLEDEDETSLSSPMGSRKKIDDSDDEEGFLLNGPILHHKSLYNHVAVGGTFDGMHYGHRKLLTLAVSSILPPPNPSQLLVGVTSDKMLQQKTLSNLIPPLEERIKNVKDFLNALAPGLKNQITVIPIEDKWGPPAYDEKFDALVLSDEVLATGLELNKFRTEQGMKELTLLCTRRTEPNGMSSTALRRWKESSSSNDVNKEI